MPVISGGSDDDDDDGDTDDGSDDGTDDGNDDPDPRDEKKFSDKDVDRIVNNRLKKDRKNKRYDDLKKKADDFDALQAEDATELDKVKTQLEEERNKNTGVGEDAEKKLIKAEVKLLAVDLSPLGKDFKGKVIVDSKAAYKLLDLDDVEVDDDGEVTGVEDAIKALIKDSPWLVKDAGAPENGKGGGKPTVNGGARRTEEGKTADVEARVKAVSERTGIK